jgi:ABC-2 type transport system permease protein
MRRWILNVWLLGAKELRSLMKDVTLVLLIVFAFTGAIVVVANGVKAEVSSLGRDHRQRSLRTFAPVARCGAGALFQAARRHRPRRCGAGDGRQPLYLRDRDSERFQADVLAGAHLRCNCSSMPRR